MDAVGALEPKLFYGWDASTKILDNFFIITFVGNFEDMMICRLAPISMITDVEFHSEAQEIQKTFTPK